MTHIEETNIAYDGEFAQKYPLFFADLACNMQEGGNGWTPCSAVEV